MTLVYIINYSIIGLGALAIWRIIKQQASITRKTIMILGLFILMSVAGFLTRKAFTEPSLPKPVQSTEINTSLLPYVDSSHNTMLKEKDTKINVDQHATKLQQLVTCAECDKEIDGYFYYSIMGNLMNIPVGRAKNYPYHYCSVKCLEIASIRNKQLK